MADVAVVISSSYIGKHVISQQAPNRSTTDGKHRQGNTIK
jgi:hypothetical protein